MSGRSASRAVAALSYQTARPWDTRSSVQYTPVKSDVLQLNPFIVEFRLLSVAGTPFANELAEMLDFDNGEVRIIGHPSGLYSNWTKVGFKH